MSRTVRLDLLGRGLSALTGTLYVQYTNTIVYLTFNQSIFLTLGCMSTQTYDGKKRYIL